MFDAVLLFEQYGFSGSRSAVKSGETKGTPRQYAASYMTNKFPHTICDVNSSSICRETVSFLL